MRAAEYLSAAAAVQQERGAEYDSPEGERSGGRIAAAFNAITGKDLTAAEVYLVLQITKDVRQWSARGYHHDSALDCVSYAALKAEALSGGPSEPELRQCDRYGGQCACDAGECRAG